VCAVVRLSAGGRLNAGWRVVLVLTVSLGWVIVALGRSL